MSASGPSGPLVFKNAAGKPENGQSHTYYFNMYLKIHQHDKCYNPKISFSFPISTLSALMSTSRCAESLQDYWGFSRYCQRLLQQSNESNERLSSAKIVTEVLLD